MGVWLPGAGGADTGFESVPRELLLLLVVAETPFPAVLSDAPCVGTCVLQKQKNMAGALAFWMANASELLNFIKQDKDLSRITLDAQDVLAHLVQVAFK